jgi:hypothetical protein
MLNKTIELDLKMQSTIILFYKKISLLFKINY